MNSATSAEARILTSAAFRRARRRASALVASSRELVGLLTQVEQKRARHACLCEGSRALDLDSLCAVVEACIDDARCTGVQEPDADSTSIAARARLRLVVATLVYLVDVEDLIPDSQVDGLTDDVVLLRWAASMARAELRAA